MATVELPDEQWSKILQFLHSCPEVYVGEEPDCRNFIEGGLWVARSGAQWRLLPARYGKWNSIYRRFARWCDKDIWERCIIILPITLTWNISLLTAPRCGPIPALLAPPQKGRPRGPSLGPEPRRVQHQNPRECGCLGQPLAL